MIFGWRWSLGLEISPSNVRGRMGLWVPENPKWGHPSLIGKYDIRQIPICFTPPTALSHCFLGHAPLSIDDNASNKSEHTHEADR